MNFAENLRRIRRMKDYTMKDLSNLTLIDEYTISLCEANLYDPTLSQIISLARTLKVSVSELIGEV